MLSPPTPFWMAYSQREAPRLRQVPRPRRLFHNAGATLIESLVAVGLFAIVAAAVGDLLTTHIRRQVTNTTATTAISLAEAELEDLRSLDYPDMTSRSKTTAVQGVTYDVGTTVLADSPAHLMKSVTTTVTWTDPAGPHTVSLYAIYTDITR